MFTPLTAEAQLRAAALETIKAGNAAYIDAVTAWNATLIKLREAPAYAELPLVVRAGLGDPAAILEQNYQLASHALELQRHAGAAWIRAWEQAVTSRG